MEYETRVIRVQSKDRENPLDSTTNFTVSFANQASLYQDSVFGISVQSISFPNFTQNVPPDVSGFVGDTGGLRLTITGPQYPGDHWIVMPGGNLSLAEFIAQLNIAFGGIDISWATFTPVPGNNNPYNLTLTFGPTWLVPGTVEVRYSRDDLNYPLGIAYPRDGVTIWDGFAGNPYSFRTNLMGPPQVYLHSSRLTQGRFGMDGNGPLHIHSTALTSIATIPITSVVGFYQQYQDTSSIQRPHIVYGGPSGIDLTNIDLSLRDDNQNLIDLGSGEITVILLAWLKNR